MKNFKLALLTLALTSGSAHPVQAADASRVYLTAGSAVAYESYAINCAPAFLPKELTLPSVIAVNLANESGFVAGEIPFYCGSPTSAPHTNTPTIPSSAYIPPINLYRSYANLSDDTLYAIAQDSVGNCSLFCINIGAFVGNAAAGVNCDVNVNGKSVLNGDKNRALSKLRSLLISGQCG